LWTLDYAGLQQRAKAIPNKRDRLHWLLTHHAYLPRKGLAALSGYSERGWSKAVRSSFISYRGASRTTSETTEVGTWSERVALTGTLHDIALAAPESPVADSVQSWSGQCKRLTTAPLKTKWR
jgi:hypothetical protein